MEEEDRTSVPCCWFLDRNSLGICVRGELLGFVKGGVLQNICKDVFIRVWVSMRFSMIPCRNHRSYVGCRHHQLPSSRGKLLSRQKHQRFPVPRQPSAHVCLVIGREVSLLPVEDVQSPC